MNSKIFLLIAGLAAISPVYGAEKDLAAPSTSTVNVNFDHPDNFTDVKDSFQGDGASSSYLAQFKEYLQSRAPKFLADGQKLTITFTDIDMAGEFEPWRSTRFQDVRIIKDIYIPRLKFDYQVTDASSAVVKQGHANLTNLNFQAESPPSFNQNDSLRYEKALLNDWLRDDLGKDLKKK